MNSQIQIYAVFASIPRLCSFSLTANPLGDLGKSKELRELRLHAYVIHLVVMLPRCKRSGHQPSCLSGKLRESSEKLPLTGVETFVVKIAFAG